MAKKIIIWAVVVLIVMVAICSFRSCYSVSVSKKPTTKSMVVEILTNVGIIDAKLDNLSAEVDTVKIEVRNLAKQKPKVVYREKTVYLPTPEVPEVSRSREVVPQAFSPVAQPRQQGQTVGTVVPPTVGLNDLLFCIDLEPSKSSDSSKKFLFWELINGLGYQIPSVEVNFTGKAANMRLAPGSSIDGISFDGEMLKISTSSMEKWHLEIMGEPMPSGWRPAIRSNKSGWSSRPMARSGDFFVYRF